MALVCRTHWCNLTSRACDYRAAGRRGTGVGHRVWSGLRHQPFPSPSPSPSPVLRFLAFLLWLLASCLSLLASLLRRKLHALAKVRLRLRQRLEHVDSMPNLCNLTSPCLRLANGTRVFYLTFRLRL